MEPAGEIRFKADNRSQKRITKLRLYISALLSIPKTLYFNFNCFPFHLAIRFPVLISYDTKIIECRRNSVLFDCKPTHFLVKVGFGGSDGVEDKKGSICLEGGILKFRGKATFCRGAIIRNKGYLSIGNGFFANKNCTIWCSKKIAVGENVLFGWNIVFRDSDGHLIIDNGMPRPVDGDIEIGSHCWICSESHVLKNSSLGNDCVLGYGSLLTNKYNQDNTLYAGKPAKPIKEKISWMRGE